MNTLRGIFPEPKTIPKRNFILENKRNLKQDRNSVQARNFTDCKKPGSLLVDKLRVGSINRSAPLKGSASSAPSKPKPELPGQSKRKLIGKPVPPRKNASESEIESDPIRARSPDYSKYMGMTQGKSFASKAMQTVDINDSEALLKNSVIRYASAGSTRSLNSLALHKNEIFENRSFSTSKNVNESREDSEKNSVLGLEEGETKNLKPKLQRCGKANEKNHERSIEHCEKDFKAIRVLKSPKLLKAKETECIDPLKAPPNYQRGVLPRYLRNRRNINSELMNVSDENCPEGHVILPESERKETLGVLRSRFAELVSELNRMPVRTDTLRQKKRKMELEDELVRLEDGMKVFSRPKVYVKVGN